MALINKLSAIGDAIREKTGSTDLMTLDEMPSAIANIQTGGGDVDALALLIEQSEPFDYDSDAVTHMYQPIFKASTLRSISLPNLTTISGSWGSSVPDAFANCYSLNSINFPNLINISGATTFEYCSNLHRVILPKFQYFENGYYQFRNSGLQVCMLPSCTAISKGCFYSCSSLQALVLSGTTVATLDNTDAFGSTSIDPDWATATDPIIFVPDDLVDSYKTATNWSVFANYIAGLSTYMDLQNAKGWPDIVYPS